MGVRGPALVLATVLAGSIVFCVAALFGLAGVAVGRGLGVRFWPGRVSDSFMPRAEAISGEMLAKSLGA